MQRNEFQIHLTSFGELEKQVVVNPRKFSRVEEISANDFIKNVLPSAKEVRVLVENKHSNNLFL